MNGGTRAVASGLVALLVVMACSSPPGRPAGDGSPSESAAVPVTVTVAAAADLRFALDELIDAYRQARPSVTIRPTYGSSGNFISQIENGAPFDVFFSADIDFPRRLERDGRAAVGATRSYATGRIVLWVRDGSQLDVATLGMDALREPAATRIAIANPEHAPYGRAAVAAMRAAGVYDAVADRLVLGENVSQAAQFVESGAADVGIIALSLALAPTLRDAGRRYLIPDDLHPPIDQGVVVLDRAVDPAEAARFVDYVLGEDGQPVLERYGFTVPEG